MKRLLIGMMLLGCVSSFAGESRNCNIVFDFEFSSKLNLADLKREVEDKGYEVVEFEKDADFKVSNYFLPRVMFAQLSIRTGEEDWNIRGVIRQERKEFDLLSHSKEKYAAKLINRLVKNIPVCNPGK